MILHKIKDFDPDYQTNFDNKDIKGFTFYTGNEKMGAVDDMLVDDEGIFRYLVINTGILIVGMKVLLPIGRCRIDYVAHRVYVNGLSRGQVESLPEYNGNMQGYFILKGKILCA